MIVGLVGLGVLALAGALAAWRMLARAGAAMGNASGPLAARAQTLPVTLTSVTAQLAAADSQSERALWVLANLDARIDNATASLGATREASDRLRARLVSGRDNLEHIREIVRLLIRLSELRRDFLG